MPGGSLEEGENPVDGAMREFYEETHQHIEFQLNLCGMIERYTRDGKRIKGLMYVFCMDSPEEIHPDLENAMDGDEHTDYGYFGVEPMRILISRTLCTNFLLVKETLLHEMCHLVMYYNLGYKNYDEHSKDFYRLVYKIAKVYGLDNKKI